MNQLCCGVVIRRMVNGAVGLRGDGDLMSDAANEAAEVLNSWDVGNMCRESW